MRVERSLRLGGRFEAAMSYGIILHRAGDGGHPTGCTVRSMGS